MVRLFSAILIVFALPYCCLANPTGDRTLEEFISHGPISCDLANALGDFAQQAQMPLFAELAQPLPRVNITAGNARVRDLLEMIIKQSPGYTFEVKGGVVHFFDERLVAAHFNFLNSTFHDFVMPGNVSALKYKFPGLVVALLSKESARGVILTGFGDPDLVGERLEEEHLNEVTGREVLFKAMTERPEFLTVIVFPSNSPKTKEEAEQATVNWFWQSLRTSERPMFVQTKYK
jgi:hypothetical protein